MAWPFTNSTFNSNKNDGGATTTTAKVVASEWNTVATDLSSLQSLEQNGRDYAYFKNMSGSMPAVAAANQARLVAKSGNLLLSRNALDYWNPFTVTNVLEYGADPTGAADSASAIQAAIDASFSGGLYGGIVFFPKGTYKVESTITITGKSGFHIVGEGKQSTNLVFAGVDGTDFFYMAGCQLWSFADMTLTTDGSAIPQSMIRSHVPSSYVFAPYGITFNSLFIQPAIVNGATYGIWFTTAGPGNNSEVNYVDCNIAGFIESCIQTEGSQAKAHCLYNVNLGVAKYGWRSYIAAVGDSCPPAAMFGGGIGSCTVAAISTDYPTDHMLIEGVQSEHCHRFYDQGGTPSNGVFPVTIRNCRLDSQLTSPAIAYSSYVRLAGPGPFIFEGNVFSAGGDGIPQIEINSGAPAEVRLSGNFFGSTNSVSTSPFNNTSGYQNSVDFGSGNFYRDSTGTQSYMRRMEPLDIAANPAMGVFTQDGKGNYLIGIPPAIWTAAAVTQTATVCTLPRGAKIKSVGIDAYAQYALPGGHTISFKLGTTSGGNELLLDGDVSTTSPVFYGAVSGDLGATMAAPVQGGVTNYHNTQALYLTATTTVENLGTGSATRMTAGNGFLVLEIVLDSRFIANT